MSAVEANLMHGPPKYGSRLANLHDYLDRIFDALASIADRGRHLGERKRMRVYQLGIEALLRHQRSGAVRRALALATNPEHVDVVAHKIGEIDGHRIGGECREADPSAAVDHPRRLIERSGRARAFEHVLHAPAAGQTLHRLDRVLAADIDDMIGAEALPHFEAAVARAG